MNERYEIDLSNPRITLPIDESHWAAGKVLEPGGVTELERAKFQPGGLDYQRHLYPKSGPQWDFYGKALASPGQSRVAVYSFDGIVQRHYEPSFKPEHFHGTYWTEIYDVASAKRLIQIRGSFRGRDLTEFQGESRWYGGRFFVQPLDVNGMQHLLICDVDAAARANGVAQADAPVPLSRSRPFYGSRSLHQTRFLEATTPQANIVGFHDEPVFYPGTQNIERLNVTAMLDVHVPGKYSLLLDLSGIQERAEGEVAVGRGELTVPFPAERLRALGSAGPYRIHWAQLTRLVEDGQIVAENRFDLETAKGISASGVLDSRGQTSLIDASTQAYSLASVGSTLYFTGQNSATLIKGVGSERDRLQVRIGFYSQEADCRGAALLARTDPRTDAAVIRGTGESTLIVNFTGVGVSEPGPYRMEYVIVFCGHDHIGPREMIVPVSGAPSK